MPAQYDTYKVDGKVVYDRTNKTITGEGEFRNSTDYTTTGMMASPVYQTASHNGPGLNSTIITFGEDGFAEVSMTVSGVAYTSVISLATYEEEDDGVFNIYPLGPKLVAFETFTGSLIPWASTREAFGCGFVKKGMQLRILASIDFAVEKISVVSKITPTAISAVNYAPEIVNGTVIDNINYFKNENHTAHLGAITYDNSFEQFEAGVEKAVPLFNNEFSHITQSSGEFGIIGNTDLGPFTFLENKYTFEKDGYATMKAVLFDLIEFFGEHTITVRDENGNVQHRWVAFAEVSHLSPRVRMYLITGACEVKKGWTVEMSAISLGAGISYCSIHNIPSYIIF